MKPLSIVTIALLLVSCGTMNSNMNSTKETIHKKWELSIINGTKVMSDKPIHIELLEDGRVTGFTGCNQLRGSYTVSDGSRIEFRQLISTRMMCRQEQIVLENQVMELLNTADNFHIEDGKLNLKIDNKTPLAVFREMVNDEIVNKYWKLISLGGRAVKMTEKQEREQYFILKSDGTISGFAGCNQFHGQYKLEAGNRIQVDENLAVTMKACPDSEINEAEYLEVFKISTNYILEGDTLSLNTGDHLPIAVFEAVYF